MSTVAKTSDWQIDDERSIRVELDMVVVCWECKRSYKYRGCIWCWGYEHEDLKRSQGTGVCNF